MVRRRLPGKSLKEHQKTHTFFLYQILLGENTEEKILKAAEEVFVQKGLDGARMQEIADKAGINKSLLHYYYRTKDKLFSKVFKIISHIFLILLLYFPISFGAKILPNFSVLYAYRTTRMANEERENTKIV